MTASDRGRVKTGALGFSVVHKWSLWPLLRLLDAQKKSNSAKSTCSEWGHAFSHGLDPKRTNAGCSFRHPVPL